MRHIINFDIYELLMKEGGYQDYNRWWAENKGIRSIYSELSNI